MTRPKHTIRTMPSGQAPATKEKFSAPLDSACPPPDRSKYIYLVSDDHIAAIEYMHRHDLWPDTTRWVSCAEVLKGIERPQVIVVNPQQPVNDAVVEALARHNAQVTYATD